MLACFSLPVPPLSSTSLPRLLRTLCVCVCLSRCRTCFGGGPDDGRDFATISGGVESKKYSLDAKKRSYEFASALNVTIIYPTHTFRRQCLECIFVLCLFFPTSSSSSIFLIFCRQILLVGGGALTMACE